MAELFKGAVLVCNERIDNAVDQYLRYYNSNQARMRELVIQAEKLISEFSKFKYWVHSRKKDTDPNWNMFIRAYVPIFDTQVDGFYHAGLICEKERKLLNSHRYNNLDTKCDLVSLIKCGKPVYLNPAQARWVNQWTFTD